MNELEWSKHYSYILDTQGHLTIVAGQVWPKIKLIKAFIVVLDSCKNDEEPSRNESISAQNITPIIGLWSFFFRHSRAANSIDLCSILLNFNPIQAFKAVHLTCKND